MAMCLAMMSGVDPIIVRKVFNYVNLRCTFYVMVTSPLTILRPIPFRTTIGAETACRHTVFLNSHYLRRNFGANEKSVENELSLLGPAPSPRGYLLRKDDQMKHTRKYSQQNQWFTYGHSLIRICM